MILFPKILLKNSSGKISKYQIYIKTEFTINYKEKTFNEYFVERFNIKNISDPFEQDNYEKTIKNNLVASIEKINIETIKLQMILKFLKLVKSI